MISPLRKVIAATPLAGSQELGIPRRPSRSRRLRPAPRLTQPDGSAGDLVDAPPHRLRWFGFLDHAESVRRRLPAFNSGAYPRQLLTFSSPPTRSKRDGAPQRLNRHGSRSSKSDDALVGSRDEPEGENVVSFIKSRRVRVARLNAHIWARLRAMQTKKGSKRPDCCHWCRRPFAHPVSRVELESCEYPCTSPSSSPL